jgi:hypothetical protein
MATGPEHYQQAEEHLKCALDGSRDALEKSHLAIAQVHATLAVAAATALGSTDAILTWDWEEWCAAASGRKRPALSEAGD